MDLYGLIGKTLKHSFSKKYFSDKFVHERIKGSNYELYELNKISDFPDLIEKNKCKFRGLNVTIPYKEDIMSFLDEIDDHAQSIQAVNTIKFLPDGRLKGYNTDYYGFKHAIADWDIKQKKALILGTGGASKAIEKVLKDLDIPYLKVSRKEGEQYITYDDIKSSPNLLHDHELVVNTTPLGTFPKTNEKASLPYDYLTSNHLMFDLVYNPETTQFMQSGLDAGAQVKNGYTMLVGQAEKSWEIWNAKD